MRLCHCGQRTISASSGVDILNLLRRCGWTHDKTEADRPMNQVQRRRAGWFNISESLWIYRTSIPID